MTIPMNVGTVTITPTGACTFNGDGQGAVDQVMQFWITSSGTTSRTLTWGTNFHTTGTLATGTTSGRHFFVTFRCKAAGVWYEMCRTAAQA
jgi:hypothetical protein